MTGSLFQVREQLSEMTERAQREDETAGPQNGQSEPEVCQVRGAIPHWGTLEGLLGSIGHIDHHSKMEFLIKHKKKSELQMADMTFSLNKAHFLSLR